MVNAVGKKLQIKIMIASWIVLGITFVILIVIGILKGDDPPGGMRCISPKNIHKVIEEKEFKIHAISRMLDNSFSNVNVAQEENFKSIGRWNKLEGLNIKKGDRYSFQVEGEISVDFQSFNKTFQVDTETSTLSVMKKDKIGFILKQLDFMEFDNKIIENLPAGDMTGIVCNNAEGLNFGANGIQVDPGKCRLYQGYGFKIALNGKEIKSAYKPFDPLITDIDLLKSQSLNKNLFSGLAGKYYINWIEAPEDGQLSFGISDDIQKSAQLNSVSGGISANIGGEYSHASSNTFSGQYNFSVIKVGYFSYDGKGSNSDDIGAVQISLRNDDAPLNWTAAGRDQTPQDQYKSFTNGVIAGEADQDYTSIWVRVKDSEYSNNTGYYNILYTNDLNIDVPADSSASNSKLSTFVNNIFEDYKKTLSNASEKIYFNLTNPNSIQVRSIIQALLVLYIIISGVFLFLGLSKVTNQEFLIKAAKFGIVITVFSERSWYFFSQYFFNIFLEGLTVISGKATADLTSSNEDYNNQFKFMDEVISNFFTSQIYNTIAALLMEPLVGWVMVAAIVYIIIKYIILVFDIIANVFTSSIVVALLIAIAPIFVALILFSKTKKMFDGLIRLLSDFLFRSVILFTGLVLLHYLINLYFIKAISFEACWEKIFSINLFKYQNIAFASLDAYGYKIKDTGQNFLLTIFINIMSFYIIVHLLERFIQIVPAMTSRITGNFSTFFSRGAGGKAGGDVSGLLSNTAETLGITKSNSDKMQEKHTRERDELKESLKRSENPTP